MDSIARLYPCNDTCQKATKAIRAHPYQLPGKSARKHKRKERGSTESPEDVASGLRGLTFIPITFSKVPLTSRGIVFGSHPDCDVVVEDPGISNYHCSLTFDDKYRLIIRDLGSSRGTQVTYGGQGRGKRKGFQWIISGDRNLKRRRSIVLKLERDVRFQIVVTPHDISSPVYIDKVNTFRRGAATTEDLLETLGLSMPITQAATGSQTPGNQPIELEKPVGEGASGIVIHLWNVSTGEERVVKQPKALEIHTGTYEREAWAREIDLMSQVSHSKIVRYLNHVMTPFPKLFLEYLPLGSLDNHTAISYHEALAITDQSLDGLQYLHSNDIAHRDIKPGNILVESRGNGQIKIKLADLGVPKQGDLLDTWCGTPTFMAPELYGSCRSEDKGLSEDEDKYTQNVDIWSLGVVACKLVFGLPEDSGNDRLGHRWCEFIIENLRGNIEVDHILFKEFLLENMLVMDSRCRSTAEECKKKLLQPIIVEEFFLDSPEEVTEASTVSASDGPSPSPQELDQPTLRAVQRSTIRTGEDEGSTIRRNR